MKMVLGDDSDWWNNPLMIVGITEIAKRNEVDDEWSVRKDRSGVDMVFYKNIPADEIIYGVGEISLALTSGIADLQQEYYDEDLGDVFNIAVKLIRDTDFAKDFYQKYNLLRLSYEKK